MQSWRSGSIYIINIKSMISWRNILVLINLGDKERDFYLFYLFIFLKNKTLKDDEF